MTLPTGPISFSQLQAEFGGSNPISLSEYYRGAAYVPSGTASAYGTIPTSGPISLGVFRGTRRAYYTNISSTGASSGFAPAQLKSYTDGTLEFIGNDSGNTVVNWFNPTTAGIGNTHWIRLTKTAGTTLTGPGVGTWLPMNTLYTWSLSANSGQSRGWSGTVEISTSSSGSPIVSSSAVGGISLFVDYT